MILRTRPWVLGGVAAALLSFVCATASATTVCVEVHRKSWAGEDLAGDAPDTPAPSAEQPTESTPPLTTDPESPNPTEAAPEPATPEEAATPPESEPASFRDMFRTPPGQRTGSRESLRGPRTSSNTVVASDEVSTEADGSSFDPVLFLQRMIEYEVTHEVGFAAADSGCEQHIVVELYPLQRGWTVFARYSGNEREEKVDEVGPDELVPLAERLTRALLRDIPISRTVTRRNVLRADTEGDLPTIGVQGHALVGLGTSIRAGSLPTADDPELPPEDQIRWITPVSVQLGYRGKYRSWGLDAFARGNLGTQERSVRLNRTGGHVDYAGGVATGLHFLQYFNPDGINTTYVGGGATFELAVFTIIRGPDRREDQDRDPLITGGLDLDLVAGYEFMRASTLHFFGQLELHAPAYLTRSEHSSGSVNTYLPGTVAQIGIIF